MSTLRYFLIGYLCARLMCSSFLGYYDVWMLTRGYSIHMSSAQKLYRFLDQT
jgi:hypothetical protein